MAKSAEDLIYDFAHGTTDLGIVKLVMRGKRFAIFRIPGHHYWADRMEPSAYARSETVLIRQGEWWLHGNKRTWQGRVSKKILQAALDAAEKKGEVID